MNDSILTEKDIRELIETKSESKNLDYKERLLWDVRSNKDEILRIIKDILAMSNTQDGGKIVFGVRDTDYNFIGLLKEDFESFDQTKVNDFLHKYTDPKFSCQVYKNTIDDKYVIVINVPEFIEEPIICKDNANSSKNENILRRGQIYIRTEKGSSEEIPSHNEMRELLGRAITKKGDELLNFIGRLIKGKPLKVEEDSKERYREEIKEANDFFDENIGDSIGNYGFWEVLSYPTIYFPERLSEHRKIEEFIRDAQVRYRGWYFPHIDKNHYSNFLKGKESFTIWERFIEGYRLYKSGLFIWKGVFSEDIEGHNINGNRVLDYINLIYSITEYFSFFRRFYEKMEFDGDLHTEIKIHDTKKRVLVSLYRSLDLSLDYISNEKNIDMIKDYKFVDIKALYKEISNEVIRKILIAFNLEVQESVIDDWQNKLLERRF